MSRILGRPVARGEVVHHINGDKTDNSDGNLYLCRDHKHHIEIERSLFVAFRSLLGAGAARFNRETALYEAIL